MKYVLLILLLSTPVFAECIDSQSLPSFQISSIPIQKNTYSVQLDTEGHTYGLLVENAKPNWTNVNGLPGLRVQRMAPSVVQLKTGQFIRIDTWKECN